MNLRPLGLMSCVTVCFLISALAVAAAPEEPRRTGLLGHEEERVLPRQGVRYLETPDLPPRNNLPRHLAFDDGVVRRQVQLMAQSFEGSFPVSPWALTAQGSADVTWGRTTFRSAGGVASAWCAKTGTDFPGDGAPVPVNTESWMVAGPFDLSGFDGGDISFDLWLQTESGFDEFGLGASLDGINFTTLLRDQNTIGWERISQDLTSWGSLGDVTGNSQVWFAFLYDSDFSIAFEGAYVDNVVLVGDEASNVNLSINQVESSNCPNNEAIVSVTDAQGAPLLNLGAGNFTLLEDGMAQSITVETATTQGNDVAVTLVLDGSGSLSSTDITNVQNASNDFIDLLNPSDRVAVFHFGSSVSLEQNFTTDKNLAQAAVNSLTNNLGSTALWDAVVDAANHSTTTFGRRALIVMTDGQNNASSNTRADAIATAQAAGVPVFTIGFGNVDQIDLQAVADQTGGDFFLGASSTDLQAILNQIGQTLNSQYVISWTTTKINGGSHSLEIRATNLGETDTALASYSQAGTACDFGDGLNVTVNQVNTDACPAAVQAICIAADDAGNPITGLTEGNFTLREDGVIKTVTVETPSTSGSAAAVTLVLDGSGSLSSTDVDNVRSASNTFIDFLGFNDQVAVYHFGSSVSLEQDFTANKDLAKAAVNSLTNGLGSTALFDAIVDAAVHSNQASGRRALVVMTDGQNNASTNSRADAIAAAQAAGVPVFTIGFGSVNQTELQAIADQTGGTFSLGATSADLQAILNRIGQALNNQYIVTWATMVFDGGDHNVTLDVTRPGGFTDTVNFIYNQSQCGRLFTDGFESGNTSAWSRTLP